MKTFTGWKYYSDTTDVPIGIMKVQPNGSCESRLLVDDEVQEWIAQGNTPEPEFTQAELDQQHLDTEKAWVKSELELADIEVRKFNDGHTRTAGTLPAWRTYRNALRDYIQSDVIIGSRPVSP